MARIRNKTDVGHCIRDFYAKFFKFNGTVMLILLILRFFPPNHLSTHANQMSLDPTWIIVANTVIFIVVLRGVLFEGTNALLPSLMGYANGHYHLYDKTTTNSRWHRLHSSDDFSCFFIGNQFVNLSLDLTRSRLIRRRSLCLRALLVRLRRKLHAIIWLSFSHTR